MQISHLYLTDSLTLAREAAAVLIIKDEMLEDWCSLSQASVQAELQVMRSAAADHSDESPTI